MRRSKSLIGTLLCLVLILSALPPRFAQAQTGASLHAYAEHAVLTTLPETRRSSLAPLFPSRFRAPLSFALPADATGPAFLDRSVRFAHWIRPAFHRKHLQSRSSENDPFISG